MNFPPRLPTLPARRHAGRRGTRASAQTPCDAGVQCIGSTAPGAWACAGPSPRRVLRTQNKTQCLHPGSSSCSQKRNDNSVERAETPTAPQRGRVLGEGFLLSRAASGSGRGLGGRPRGGTGGTTQIAHHLLHSETACFPPTT